MDPTQAWRAAAAPNLGGQRINLNVDTAIPDAWAPWAADQEEATYIQQQLAEALGRVAIRAETADEMADTDGATPQGQTDGGGPTDDEGCDEWAHGDGGAMDAAMTEPSREESSTLPASGPPSAASPSPGPMESSEGLEGQDAESPETEPVKLTGDPIPQEETAVVLPAVEISYPTKEEAQARRLAQANSIFDELPRRVGKTIQDAFDRTDSGTVKSVSEQSKRYPARNGDENQTQLLFVIDIGLGHGPEEPHIVSLAAYDPTPRRAPAEAVRLGHRLAFSDFRTFELAAPASEDLDTFFGPLNEAIESILAVLAVELSHRDEVIGPALLLPDHALGSDVRKIKGLFHPTSKDRPTLPALTLTAKEREILGPEPEENSPRRAAGAIR